MIRRAVVDPHYILLQKRMRRRVTKPARWYLRAAFSQTRTEAMTIYSQLRTYTEQLSGSAGPTGVGSINLTGGKEIQITFNPAGAGTRVVSVVPYMVGADKTSSGNPPPPGHQRLLAWQYVCAPPPAPPALPGWRCFKVQQISAITSGALPRPAAQPFDPVGQNCVRTY
jgi:hypothetical protein